MQIIFFIRKLISFEFLSPIFVLRALSYLALAASWFWFWLALSEGRQIIKAKVLLLVAMVLLGGKLVAEVMKYGYLDELKVIWTYLFAFSIGSILLLSKPRFQVIAGLVVPGIIILINIFADLIAGNSGLSRFSVAKQNYFLAGHIFFILVSYMFLTLSLIFAVLLKLYSTKLKGQLLPKLRIVISIDKLLRYNFAALICSFISLNFGLILGGLIIGGLINENHSIFEVSSFARLVMPAILWALLAGVIVFTLVSGRRSRVLSWGPIIICAIAALTLIFEWGFIAF